MAGAESAGCDCAEDTASLACTAGTTSRAVGQRKVLAAYHIPGAIHRACERALTLLLHLLRSSQTAVTEVDPSTHAQANSAALGKYIAARGRIPATAGATVPEQIDEALQRLHASVAACESLLARLQAATASMEEVLHSSITPDPSGAIVIRHAATDTAQPCNTDADALYQKVIIHVRVHAMPTAGCGVGGEQPGGAHAVRSRLAGCGIADCQHHRLCGA